MEMPQQFPVTCHTDHVGPGSTFVAIKGYKEDGIAYIPLAIEKGATTLVVAHDIDLPIDLHALIQERNVVLYPVANPRLALAELSAQAAGYPARKLKIIGVTGTKGKTTTAFILEHILKTAGYKTALLTTVHNKILDTIFDTKLTTQHPDYLHQFFKLCVESQVEYVVMEVAAQALSLQRLATIEFDGALFTNFAQEHGEFYSTQQDYFRAKCLLFAQLKNGAPALFNGDDRCLQGSDVPLNSNTYRYRYSLLNDHADFVVQQYSAFPLLEYVFVSDMHDTCIITCPTLIGQFNIYNTVAAASMTILLGIRGDIIVHALRTFQSVPGRLERYILGNGALCIIDYAHNPSSYQALLSLLRTTTNHLIVVFGAGGQRDHEKRPRMGTIAAQYADVVILTSDNPRTEDPQLIVDDIKAGITPDQRAHVLCELDREQAIKKAYALSKEGSVIALLGKGQEEYQIIGTTVIPYSDKKVVSSLY